MTHYLLEMVLLYMSLTAQLQFERSRSHHCTTYIKKSIEKKYQPQSLMTTGITPNIEKIRLYRI